MFFSIIQLLFPLSVCSVSSSRTCSEVAQCITFHLCYTAQTTLSSGSSLCSNTHLLLFIIIHSSSFSFLGPKILCSISLFHVAMTVTTVFVFRLLIYQISYNLLNFWMGSHCMEHNVSFPDHTCHWDHWQIKWSTQIPRLTWGRRAWLWHTFNAAWALYILIILWNVKAVGM